MEKYNKTMLYKSVYSFLNSEGYLLKFLNYSVSFLNLKAFTITETEEKLIAVAVIIGENRIPKNKT